MIGKKIMTAATLALLATIAIPASAKAGEYCREYTRTVYIANRPHQAYGTACTWVRMEPGASPRENLGVSPGQAVVESNDITFTDAAPAQVVVQPAQYVAYAPPPPAYYPGYYPAYYPAYYAPEPVISFGFYGGHRHWH